MPVGQAVTGKLVAGLRRLGFNAVFDTTFGADLTIVEESKRSSTAWAEREFAYFDVLLPGLDQLP
jgi:iron only hydrogenase large subunit-like protein